MELALKSATVLSQQQTNAQGGGAGKKKQEKNLFQVKLKSVTVNTKKKRTQSNRL